MTYGSTEHGIVPGPPPAVLAELDAAARALAALDRRGARVTLAVGDEPASVRIELVDADDVRSLRPAELFHLLA